MDLKDLQETGRLNLSGFIDLNKSVLSEQDFNKKYLTGKYEIYTEKSISDFKKAISNELVKGEMDVEGLKITNNELSKLVKVEFMKGDTSVVVFVKSIGDNDLVAPKDELEKGMVTDSFGSYSNNKLSFNKTGKQIKDQINTVLLVLLNAQKVSLEAELALVSKDITIDPDSFIDEYEYRGFAKILPKVGRYSYDLCETKYDSMTQKYEPISDEKKCCQQYNQIARNIVSTMADIQYATLLERNVEESKKYELTSDQVLALQF